MSILTRIQPLIRNHISDLKDANAGCDSSALVSSMVRSLTGQHDLDLVREAMIERYAQVIVPSKDAITGAESNTLYRANSQLRLDYAAKEAILAGQQEIVRLYLYPSVVRQRATLFGEPSQHYEYDTEGAGETIGDVRENGGANLAAQRWDSYADGIGSCALYVSLSGSRLSYQTIPPHRIWAAFAEEIQDGDKWRAVDGENLDEASVVAIELAPKADKRRFAAWFGPSTKYPLGRHVIYTATDWYDVPDPGDMDARDYSAVTGAFGVVSVVDELANPLTLIARTQRAEGAPTYPIAILYGDTISSGLMPVTTTLYEVAAEIDLMGSMVIGAAGRGARGAQAFKKGDDPTIPDVMNEGAVLLGRNQELANIGWPASHSKDAMAVLNEYMRHVAEAHCVPGWLVVADEVGQVPSGVALMIALQPLDRYRASRIAINKASVRRRWEIERAIVNGAMGKPSIPWDCVETWDAGARKWPTDPLVEAQIWQARLALGEASMLDVWKEFRGFATDEQAMAWAEEQIEKRKAIPDLAPKSTARPSVAQRLGGGAAGGGASQGNGTVPLAPRRTA